MSVAQLAKLPKTMRHQEWCIVCKKEMTIVSAEIVGDAVQVWYQCECGERIGFAYWGGFVEMFKKVAGTESHGEVPFSSFVDPGLEKQE